MTKTKVSSEYFNKNYKSGYYLSPKVVASNEKSEGCFVATFAYGSYENQNVIILREYRDEILSKSILGNAFIKTYYRISPKIVWLLDKIYFPKYIVKFFIEIFIVLIAKRS